MKIKQNTLQDIIDTEKDLILRAPSKYDEFFDFALESFVLIENFIKSINPEAFIFAAFLSQIRKHHTLALLSSVRLHHVQTMMNLRQVLEAGSCAAYAIANHNSEDFKNGKRDKIYKWLKSNYLNKSEEIKRIKGLINSSAAHSNVIYAHKNYSPDMKNKRFNTPFFDFEDEFCVKADLWLTGNVAMGLMDLFYEINRDYNMLVFSDNFIEEIKKLQIKNNSLRNKVLGDKRFNKIKNSL